MSQNCFFSIDSSKVNPFVVVKRWSNAMSSDGKSMLPPIHASCAKATAMW